MKLQWGNEGAVFVIEPRGAGIDQGTPEEGRAVFGDLDADGIVARLHVIGEGGGVLPEGVRAVGFDGGLEGHGVIPDGDHAGATVGPAGIDGGILRLSAGQVNALVRVPPIGGAIAVNTGEDHRQGHQGDEEDLRVSVKVAESVHGSTSFCK